MSEVSVQHSMLEHAYQSIKDAFSANDGQLVGGDGSLNWKASLSLATSQAHAAVGVNRLDGLVDGLVVGYLMELMATHSDPSRCRKQINSCQDFDGSCCDLPCLGNCLAI